MTTILDPDWNCFLEVARTGSISRAATELRMQQPGITRRLKRLEASVGGVLFERSHRGAILTPFGKSIYSKLLPFRDRLQDLLVEETQRAAEPQGTFRLGCHRVVGLSYLPERIQRLAKRFPRIRFEFCFATSQEVAQKVLDHDLDYGMVVNPPPSPQLMMRRIDEEAVYLYRSAKGDSLPAMSDAGVLFYNPEMIWVTRLIKRFKRRELRSVADYEMIAALIAQSPVDQGILPASVATRWGLRRVGPAPLVRTPVVLIYRRAMTGLRAHEMILREWRGLSPSLR